MKCDGQNFFVILDPFLHLYPRSKLKNQLLEKMQKVLGDIIILHMFIINGNHIMYGSLDMDHNGYNFLPFWTIFCPFSLLTHSLHPPSFLLGFRVEPRTKFLKRGALKGPQLLGRGCWERQDDFFQGRGVAVFA